MSNPNPDDALIRKGKLVLASRLADIERERDMFKHNYDQIIPMVDDFEKRCLKAEAEAAEARAERDEAIGRAKGVASDSLANLLARAEQAEGREARLREALETIQQMLSADPGRSSLLGTVLSAESIARAALSNPPTGEAQKETDEQIHGFSVTDASGKRIDPSLIESLPPTSREGTDR